LHQHDGSERHGIELVAVANINRARPQSELASRRRTGDRLMPVRGDAIPYVGIYTLDLFCDQLHEPCVEATFTGQTFSGCCAKAKKAGWRINRDSKTATCPICTKRMRNMARSLAQGRQYEMRRTAQ
jgi:hypothetical protein